MSDSNHHHHIEHKSLNAYIIGFVLSLIFTIVPYELVVKHSLTSTNLLLAIMAFAVVQLIVQITFFLHLGRGPKPKWNLFFFIATVGIILVVVGGSIIIINNLHRNLPLVDQTRRLVDSEGISQVGGQQTGACQVVRSNHLITIEDGNVQPALVKAKKCDTLTFMDMETVNLDITFDSADHAKTYAGLDLLAVQKGHSKTITLSETGTFKFENNLDPSIIGNFTVSEK